MMVKTVVVGLGKSGRAACDLLRSEGDEVVGVDDNPALKASLPCALKEFDRLIVSPGVPLTHPLVVEAKQLDIPVMGEVELALRRLQVPIIGVTGTNGKTTVTLLITHILKAAGFSAQALGNIGEPLSTYVSRAKKGDIAVVELSSFQLDTLSFPCCDVGVILNITPDHLDRYDSMESYAASKCHLQRCLKPGGKLWVHESVVKDFKPLLQEGYQVYLSENEEAAWVVCQELGVSKAVFQEAVRSFKRPPHRIEWVASIDGVDYVDDSKGTNIDAVIKAVREMNQQVLLIAGGVDKGASYSVWKKVFREKVRFVVAIGAAAEKIAKDLAPDYQVSIMPTLKDAVYLCNSVAQKGDVVLLSPGCSSYDMFRDYAHRGDEFKRIVDLLKEKKG